MIIDAAGAVIYMIHAGGNWGVNKRGELVVLIRHIKWEKLMWICMNALRWRSTN
jgi:hypothetical protein